MMKSTPILIAICSIVTASFLFGQSAPAPAPAPAPSTQPTTKPANLPPGQLLDQMLKPQGPNGGGQALQPVLDLPTVDASSGAAAVMPGAQPTNLMREGSFLVDRLGRMTKSADGQHFEFNFDSDGRTMQDAPVIVLPNLKLTAMQNAVQSSSRDLRFRITGMVTEYNGRNYVLLEKAVIVPDSMQQF